MSTPTHFNCDHCGKRYAWKPQLAGKKAKCGCGQMLTVPAGMAPKPVAEEDLYDFAEPDVKPKPARPVTTVAQSMAAAGTPGGAAVLAYGTGKTGVIEDPDKKKRGGFDDFYHAPRDFYWPSGVLAVGFILLLAWAVAIGADGVGLVFFTAYITVATVIKTVLMIGAAFIIAPMAGISFGTLWTAVLKLTALVVMTDAGLFWLEHAMELMGAVPGQGGGRRGYWAVGVVKTMLCAAIIAFLSHIFFDMDREEIGTFAIPMAIVNRLLNFFLMLVLSGIVSAMASAAAGPGPAAGGGGGGTAAPPASALPPPAAPVEVAPTPANKDVEKRDRAVEREILSNRLTQNAFTFFGNAETDAKPQRGAPLRNRDRQRFGKRDLDGMADFHATLLNTRRTLMLGLQQAGVRGAYVELVTDPDRTFKATRLVVELPYGKEDRAKAIEMLKEHVAMENVTFDAEKELVDQGNKYLVIPLQDVAAPPG